MSLLLFLVRVPLREAILARLVVPDSRVSCYNLRKQVLARLVMVVRSCSRGYRDRGEVRKILNECVFLSSSSVHLFGHVNAGATELQQDSS